MKLFFTQFLQKHNYSAKTIPYEHPHQTRQGNSLVDFTFSLFTFHFSLISIPFLKSVNVNHRKRPARKISVGLFHLDFLLKLLYNDSIKLLYIFIAMLARNKDFSSDYYSLLFSYFEFVFSTVAFMNGAGNMTVNVLVVVGCYMVGTKSWKNHIFVLRKRNKD